MTSKFIIFIFGFLITPLLIFSIASMQIYTIEKNNKKISSARTVALLNLEDISKWQKLSVNTESTINDGWVKPSGSNRKWPDIVEFNHSIYSMFLGKEKGSLSEDNKAPVQVRLCPIEGNANKQCYRFIDK